MDAWMPQVLILAKTIMGGMDAQVPWLAIDGVQLVFSLGLLELSMDKMRRGWRMQRRAMMIRIASGFVGVGWEVGWGVMDTMLSLIAPESDWD